MSGATRFLLIAGCAVVLALEGPRTVAVLADSWSGPYPNDRVAELPRFAETVRMAAAGSSLAVPTGLVPRELAPIGLLGLPRR